MVALIKFSADEDAGIEYYLKCVEQSLGKNVVVFNVCNILSVFNILLELRKYNQVIIGHPHLIFFVFCIFLYGRNRYFNVFWYGIDIVQARRKLVCRLGYRFVDAHFTISRYSQKLLSEHWGLNESNLIPSAVEFSNRIPVFDRADGGLITISRLNFNEYKGQHVIVSALEYLEGSISYTIAGSGTDERITRAIERLDRGSERVVLKGRITDREKVLELESSRLFCLPSMYEGFGIAALEALAHGCPVLIHQDFGGRDVQKLAPSMVFLVSSWDPSHVAAVIQRALDGQSGSNSHYLNLSKTYSLSAFNSKIKKQFSSA